MAYVPPSKRPGFLAKTTDKPPWVRPARKTYEDHLRELETLFLTHQQGTFNYFAHPDRRPTPREGPASIEGSLPTKWNSTTPEAHVLGHVVIYIVIFPNAQPLWESGAELWTHTGAEGMISDWKGAKVNFGRPIPVFEVSKGRKNGNLFMGWWTMNALREVEVGSPEQIDLLETKERFRGYSRDGRTKEAWEISLAEQWIKTRFTPVEESFERYSELVDPTTLGPGDGAKLVLSVGGLEEELKVLEGLQVTNYSEVEGEGAKNYIWGEPVRGQEAA